MRTLWGIDYAVEPSATQAAVGGYVVGVGFTAAVTPMVLATITARTDVTQWSYVAVGLVIMGLQVLVMSADLVRLLGATFRAPSPIKTLTELLAMMVSITLIGLGLGGVAEAMYPWLLIIAVLIAATIGNRQMVLAVTGPATIFALAPAILDGTDVSDQFIRTATFIAVAVASAAIVTETRDAGVRAADRFDRLTETTEVILRADAFEEALARFLPLVAAQVGSDQISAFLDRPDGERIWLGGLGDAPDDDRMDGWSAPTDGLNGYEIDPARTYAWARGDDGRVAVIIVHRGPPGWRRKVAFRAALRQIAPELELLLRHTDLLVQLDRLSRTDALTGLPNRLELVDRITQERARAARSGEPLAVAMIDLDEFKSYNDLYGHLEGDQALASLGALILARLRGGDFVCRYGGEEFFFVMPNTTIDGATFVLDQLRTLAGALPAPRPLSFSAGIAAWEAPEDNDQLIVRADNALYQAKAAGRHTTVAAAPRHQPGHPSPTPRRNAHSTVVDR